MWYNVYNLVNQCLLFISKIFPYLESNAQSYNCIIMHWLTVLYIKSNSSLFWFIVHALLKWYLYLQYLQKESLPRPLTHIQTHPYWHPLHSPMHPHQWDVEGQTPKIRQLLGIRVDLFFNFFENRKARGNAFGHYNANWVCVYYIYGS